MPLLNRQPKGLAARGFSGPESKPAPANNRSKKARRPSHAHPQPPPTAPYGLRTLFRAVPGRCDTHQLPLQTPPSTNPYGLAGELQPMAAAIAWPATHTANPNGTVGRPPALLHADMGRVIVNGVGFPVFNRKDFVNQLTDTSSGSWKRLRQGDNGSQVEWVWRSPFGIT